MQTQTYTLKPITSDNRALLEAIAINGPKGNNATTELAT
jgi:hypothetical protein